MRWVGGVFCCYQFCVGRMVTIALEHKPVFKKGRCKGKFVTTLNIERELEQFCNEKYHLLSKFHVYGIAVLYSDEELIKRNLFYIDKTNFIKEWWENDDAVILITRPGALGRL